MATYTELSSSRMFSVKDDHIVFDTNNKSVNLFPDGYNLSRTVAAGNPVSIDFPDLLKANAYYRFGEGFYSGGRTSCRSYATFLYQEWGPDYPNADDYYSPMGSPQYWANIASNFRNLPREYIGSVPAETDYLDVRVRLTNTVVPSTVMGIPIFPLLQAGQWVNLPGGSCPIELRSPLARLFNIKRFGNDIYLERFQSVYRGQQIPWLNGNSDANTSGWTWGAYPLPPPTNTPGGFGAHAELGRLAQQLEYKAPDTNGNKRRNGTNACSVVDTTNYRSVWYGDLVIRPGRRT